MTSNDRLARLAGLLYLLLLPTCGLALGGGKMMGEGGAILTPALLHASRGLLELQVVAGAIGFVIWLVLGVVFHRLFGPACRYASSILVVFVAAAVILGLAALARQMDALSLLDASQALSALSGDQFRAHAALAQHGSWNLMLASILFWGLWLLPLGWLVFRSGFVPRLFGVLLMLGAPFYVLIFAGTVLDPGYLQSSLAHVVGVVFGIPGVIGELGTALWLLVMGTRKARRDDVPASAAAA